MTFRDHGYYGYAYLGARAASIVSLVPVVGLVGNFLSMIAKSKHTAPGEFIVTLVMTCIALLWSLVSVTAYDDTHIPYLVTAAVDFLLLVPFIVIAVILGQPLSSTTCSALPKPNRLSSLPIPEAHRVGYPTFVAAAGRPACYELMAAWGLAIALCVLFTISAVAATFLFVGKRRAEAAERKLGGSSRGGSWPLGYGPDESQIEMVPTPPEATFQRGDGDFRPPSRAGSSYAKRFDERFD
ncbi:hypothetical protein VTK73DRAFT_3898 [Phialemonium thermophilum]|uniref:MARVEL domain-containing protein n=1 Tax=Phialemonium thermophilum TaxID=223376 RepID=A0ABR3WW96_9PEZI